MTAKQVISSCLQEVGVLPPKTTVVQHRGFPDQKREQEVDSAAAEDFQHLMQNLHLPDAHRLYSYGERQIVFSTVVAAPQENAGVVIVQDYVGFPQQPGHQIVHSDEAIQNDAWQRQGPFLPIRDGTFGLPSAADWRRVDWSQAVDMRGARQLAAQRGATNMRGCVVADDGGDKFPQWGWPNRQSIALLASSPTRLSYRQSWQRSSQRWRKLLRFSKRSWMGDMWLYRCRPVLQYMLSGLWQHVGLTTNETAMTPATGQAPPRTEGSANQQPSSAPVAPCAGAGDQGTDVQRTDGSPGPSSSTRDGTANGTSRGSPPSPEAVRGSEPKVLSFQRFNPEKLLVDHEKVAEINRLCAAKKEKYVDPQFPPSASSLYMSLQEDGVWKSMQMAAMGDWPVESREDLDDFLQPERCQGPELVLFTHENDAHQVRQSFEDAAKEISGLACLGILECSTWPIACRTQNVRRTPAVMLYPTGNRAGRFYRGRFTEEGFTSAVANMIAFNDRTVSVTSALSSDAELWPHMDFGFVPEDLRQM
eukprot:g11800.t1